MKKTLLIGGLSIFMMGAVACGSKPADPTKSPAANKPAANKPANKPTKTDTKVAKAGDKKPDLPKKEIPAGKKVPVPTDWDVVYDEARGYEFSVPSGTLSDWQTVGDTDVYIAKLPNPAEISVMVVAYKDENTEKDAILATAKKIVESLGETDVKFSDTREQLNDDYFLVEFTSKDSKGATSKGKVLIAVDLTDNFLMFCVSPEAQYKANEQVINELWSSFSMYSGGNSGGM
jgi:hypothetical protein